MKYFLLLLIFVCFAFDVEAQQLSPDEIFKKVESKFSPAELLKIIKEYNEADEVKKAMILNVLSMPMSSKREMIENYETNRTNVDYLIDLYRRLVPKGYIIGVELKSPNLVPGMVEALDFQIYKENPNGEPEYIDGDWDMTYGSEELDELLEIVGWDRTHLLMVKNLLQTAKCISIQNNEDHYEVGFARSGLGKLSYLIFPKKISKKQLEKYSDTCQYIRHKDNVILKFVGGMAGPQCFTD